MLTGQGNMPKVDSKTLRQKIWRVARMLAPLRPASEWGGRSDSFFPAGKCGGLSKQLGAQSGDVTSQILQASVAVLVNMQAVQAVSAELSKRQIDEN
jgi:hypothetical protein